MVTRQAVLSALAAESDSEGRRTTVDVLARRLDAPERAVRTTVAALVDCDLAVRDGDDVRVSVTGEELLALDVGGEVVLDLDSVCE